MFSYTYDKNDKNIYEVRIWKEKRLIDMYMIYMCICITIGGQTCHSCHNPVLSMVCGKANLSWSCHREN